MMTKCPESRDGRHFFKGYCDSTYVFCDWCGTIQEADVQAYQPVELASGEWEVFSTVTGERVSVEKTKAAAVALVATMNRHNAQVLGAISSLFQTGAR